MSTDSRNSNMKFISCHLQLLKLSPRSVKNHRWIVSQGSSDSFGECNPALSLGSEDWIAMHQHRVADWCSAETDRHHWGQVESPSVTSSKYDYINITFVRLLQMTCCVFKYTALFSPKLCVPYFTNMTDL